MGFPTDEGDAMQESNGVMAGLGIQRADEENLGSHDLIAE